MRSRRIRPQFAGKKAFWAVKCATCYNVVIKQTVFMSKSALPRDRSADDIPDTKNDLERISR